LIERRNPVFSNVRGELVNNVYVQDRVRLDINAYAKSVWSIEMSPDIFKFTLARNYEGDIKMQ
jgi:hypothetical protein